MLQPPQFANLSSRIGPSFIGVEGDAADVAPREGAASAAAAAIANAFQAAESEQAAAKAPAAAAMTTAPLTAAFPAGTQLQQQVKKAACPPTPTSRQAIAAAAAQARTSHRVRRTSAVAGQQRLTRTSSKFQAAEQAPLRRRQGQRCLQQPRSRVLQPNQ